MSAFQVPTTDSTLPVPDAQFSFVGRFLRYFIVVFLPVGLLVAVPIWHHGRTEATLLRVSQQNYVRLQSEIIAAAFRSIAADLLILADSYALQQLIRQDTPQDRDQVAREFCNVAQRKQLYDQIRYINNAGLEIVRVNLRAGVGVAVPVAELQSKGDRYYFGETMRCERNEIFVSPFDLNFEAGQIEQPPKPTVRLATPVFDPQGGHRGILIVNYLGQRLFDKIAQAAAGSAGETWLLNSDGYWLYGPDPAKNWAFMYPERIHASLPISNSKVWRSLQHAAKGQFSCDGSLYTYQVLQLLRQIQTDAHASVAGATATEATPHLNDWIVVACIPPVTMAAHTGRLWSVLLPIELGLATGVGAISWFLVRATYRQEQAQQRLVQSARLAAIGEAMAGLTHESRNALQRSQSGLEMLSRRVADRPEALSLIQQVQEAQHYLYNLYETVRGYAAPLAIRRQPTDLKQLALAVWNQVLSERSAAQASLSCHLNTIDAVCPVDPHALGQVLRNLFENALAASTGSPQVRITWCDTTLGRSAALAMAVHDNGPGLTPEEQRRIFEPFFTTKVHGTGLGMAISKRIVEQHGGQLVVGDSVGNAGAELVVILPRSCT